MKIVVQGDVRRDVQTCLPSLSSFWGTGPSSFSSGQRAKTSVVKRQVVGGLGAFHSRECALSSRLRSFGKEGQPRVEMLTLIHVPTELRSQSFCPGIGWTRKAGSPEGALSSQEGGKGGILEAEEEN